MDTTGTIDSATSEATAKTDAGGSASEQVASQGTQGQETNAGGEQSSTEGGRDEGTDQRRPRFKSKNETIFELKQKLRERDSYWEGEVGTVKEQLAELHRKFGKGQEQKPSRTFYEAPEDVLRDIQSEGLQSLKEELLQEMRTLREQDRESMSQRQEASEAAKFIKSQEGLTKDDILELSAIIREEPIMERLSPMERAEYALFIYGKNRGVTDKTALKQRAAGVQGAGASPNGKRQWTESEMAQEMGKLGNPKNWTNEVRQKARDMEREFMSAYKDGRVKK